MSTTEVQAAAEAEGPEITEIVAFDVAKVAGAHTPANGTPFLMMKALAEPAAKAKGAARLEPPTDDGFQGRYGGVPAPGPDAGGGEGCGCCAACKCPPAAAKSAPDGIEAQAAAAAKAVLDAYATIDGDWSYPADELAKAARTFTAADRKQNASQGNALPDGSYPIPDADALRRAAILARSKKGNWKAAVRLIARRARELGVRNPMKKNPKGAAAKATVAEGGTVVDTGAQDDLAKTVQDAVTKATEPLAKEIADLKSAKDHLQGELAKVLALPQPGGPVMSVTRPGTDGTGAKKAGLIAKAEQQEHLARTMTDQSMADQAAKLAAQYRAEAAALDG